ncbi:Integral inner nuclear membrane protein-like protein [Emericellopsis cladophorae]|uniref:Integral inner nuclear membrane protein-like protein n=1 Tax=Emericellopsis cladophorae TaxID=2686198 RepID=A0A9Q0BET7_9HYPO|nr:Integral inner nuclear membrane protein-like protein [Emericellopsis cladophorae]KAI6781579.1 Integral inner nuclear membrane protein-like protein [Emericellopsis cladophorae]
MSDKSSADIFCATCQKNQHLFVTSLAQYTSSDPSNDSDFGLDKEYYRFRRGLEKRYPQVCESCAKNVERKIRNAEYTAKTDHLRKMTEKGRQVRTIYAQRTWLDYIDALGRWLWRVGLGSQVFWHLLGSLELLAQSPDGMSNPDGDGWLKHGASAVVEQVRDPLGNGVLLQASLATSLASAWWNPKFVQVSRGFTRQLSGLGHWYFFQALICGMRFVLPLSDVSSQNRSAQLCIHLALASLTIFFSILAPRCIRTDMTPIFGQHKPPLAPTSQPTWVEHEGREASQSFAETLGAALEETPRSALPPDVDMSAIRESSPFAASPSRRGLVDEFQDEDAMEWTPTNAQALPRALRESPRGNQPAFGAAPTQEGSRPFYFKVPEAPSCPAKKARLPAHQPVIWGSSGGNEWTQNKGVEATSRASPMVSTAEQQYTQTKTNRTNVDFANPRWHAPRQGDAEDGELADLLVKGFSLEPGKKGAGTSTRSWLGF